ncbi:uncharacterized protein [Venturia canescens]|uniref:uncharacterized protein n=1 Tax=Venturia canescens TaxID=32260 RepID=UPI001C9BC807|nr:uncharacterized protein LOC122415773 [Venturia canescens]
MSKLAVILCVLGFYAAAAIANPRSKSQSQVLGIVEEASNAITERTNQIFKKFESLRSVNSSDALPFPTRGRTFGQFISQLNKNVEHDFKSFPPVDEQQRIEHTNKCRKIVSTFKNKLENAIHVTYMTTLKENNKTLLEEKDRQLSNMANLKATAEKCQGTECEQIASILNQLKRNFIDYSEQVENDFARIADGSAIKKWFYEMNNKVYLSHEMSKMVYDLHQCIVGHRRWAQYEPV